MQAMVEHERGEFVRWADYNAGRLSRSPDAVTAAAYAMCEMRGDSWNGTFHNRSMWADLARAALEAAEKTPMPDHSQRAEIRMVLDEVVEAAKGADRDGEYLDLAPFVDRLAASADLGDVAALAAGLEKAIELLDADTFDRGEIDPLRELATTSWRCEGCGTATGRYDRGPACDSCVMESFAEHG